MGYADIPNLYADQKILLFKECYALEKIHGTSTSILWKGDKIHFHSGGIDHQKFVQLFDENRLQNLFRKLGNPEVRIRGEAYGGDCQGMRDVYGDDIRFVAFEVEIGGCNLNVPNAHDVAHNQFGMDFVDFEKIPAELDAIREQRDRPSVQAQRNGMGEQIREGVVLRPPVTVRLNNDKRIMAKCKNEKYQERQNQPDPKEVDPERMQVLRNSEEIAQEWVGGMRLTHVLDDFRSQEGRDANLKDTGRIIKMMIADVGKESEGEIEGDWRMIGKAIGSRTAELFHRRLKNQMEEQ